jgi:signal transduction histidine kinase
LKLLHKSALYYVILLVPILISSGFILFWIIDREINEDTDHSLHNKKEIIERHFSKLDSVNLAFFGSDNEVKIKKLAQRPAKNREVYSDTVLYIHAHGRRHSIPYRKLTASLQKQGNYYSIEILQSKVRSDEIIESILQSLFIIFGLLLLGLVILNSVISKTLWRPFYETLHRLSTISFSQKNPPEFERSPITEFDQLNSLLNKVTGKMFRDYESQKQFTENASHELQTPLAVIKAKTDLLLQSRAVSETDMVLITDIERSVSKLAYLNRSLLLLSKLENRQFDETSPINFPNLLDQILDTFEDRIVLKQITVQKNYIDNVTLSLNPVTAEILFANLLQNAIRYNFNEGGIIKIEITHSRITIANTGPEWKGNADHIFDRFTKFNTNTDSMGLGLAIVKQVCEYYNFRINYAFERGMHTFTIDLTSNIQ